MSSEVKIFDAEYVNENQTEVQIEIKSGTKEFIKKPLNPDEMAKYGTSKPTRIVIKAKITNG